MSKRSRQHRGSSSRSQRVNYGELVHSWGVFDNVATTTKYAELCNHHIDSGAVIDWEFMRSEGLEAAFLGRIHTDGFAGPQWERLFRIRDTVYSELVREFFATFHFDQAEARTDMGGTTIYFRLGGEVRSCSVTEFGWRIGLYTREEAVDGGFMQRLLHGETLRSDMRCVTFWPTIRDGVYTSTTGAASIRDPIVRLVHRCITYSLSGRHGTTHRVTASDLFYLYTIFSADVYCNIPFWVASYLKTSVGERDIDKVYGGMFVTRLARSYDLLTPPIMGYLSDCGSCRVVRAKSLRQMSIVMLQGNGTYVWYADGGPDDVDDDDDDEEAPQQHQFEGYEVGTADYY